jgi:hypothetical protein
MKREESRSEKAGGLLAKGLSTKGPVWGRHRAAGGPEMLVSALACLAARPLANWRLTGATS